MNRNSNESEYQNEANRDEIDRLLKLVNVYEEHNLKIPELEKKLKLLQAKYEKDMKELESIYKQKIKSLSRKLEKYEETIKTNRRYDQPEGQTVSFSIYIFSLSELARLLFQHSLVDPTLQYPK